MKNKALKKIVALFMLLSIIQSSISYKVSAQSIGNEVYLEDKGSCGYHLQYYNEERKGWYYIRCTYVTYNENGKEYPAYCLNKENPGVEEYGNYVVDLTEKLNDDRIWRIIANGYPYQTPQEMGLENEYDAFVATKQAIYSIMYGYNARTRYRGEDDRGKSITNAIINLVDIGINGTQMPYIGEITANKVGVLKEEENYYSQEFTINCGTNIENYTIIANELPLGSKITNLNNNEMTTFSSSTNFKIKIPKSSMNTNININFSIKAQAKTYPVFYGRTRVEGTQNYAITYESYGDIISTVNLTILTNTGKIHINKTDEDTKIPIAGVKFQLMKNDGTIVADAITNENGIAIFSELYQDKYILKEIASNENYVLNETNFNVNVEYNKTTIQNVTNEHKKGQFKIIKVDKDNDKIKIPNVEFKLYDEKGNFIESLIADENGEAISKKLPINQKYIIQEIKTGDSYVLDDQYQTIELKQDEIISIIFQNKKIQGCVEITKVDSKTKETLKGAIFGIYNENDEEVAKLETNDNGKVISELLPYGKYYLREIDTGSKQYLLNKNKYEFEIVKDNEIISFEIENDPIEVIESVIEIPKLPITGK